jgi:zinc protease
MARADDPAELRDVLAAVGFGARHPYGQAHLGTPETLATITRADVIAFHRAHYRPGGAALIFVGDVTLAGAERLAQTSAFGRWAKGTPSERTVGEARPAGRGIVIVDRPEAAESEIALVFPTAPRATPDFIALSVAEACIGGTFSSRLNLSLREGHGYSYGATAAIWWHRGPSLFVAQSAVRPDVTLAALAELRNELHRIGREPPTAAELDLAKAQLIHGVVGAFELMSTALDEISELFWFRLPLDYHQRFAAQVAAVSAEDVRRAIERLDLDGGTAVIVGDRKSIERDLRIEVRDPFGRPVKGHVR